MQASLDGYFTSVASLLVAETATLLGVYAAPQAFMLPVRARFAPPCLGRRESVAQRPPTLSISPPLLSPRSNIRTPPALRLWT